MKTPIKYLVRVFEDGKLIREWPNRNKGAAMRRCQQSRQYCEGYAGCVFRIVKA